MKYSMKAPQPWWDLWFSLKGSYVRGIVCVCVWVWGGGCFQRWRLKGSRKRRTRRRRVRNSKGSVHMIPFICVWCSHACVIPVPLPSRIPTSPTWHPWMPASLIEHPSPSQGVWLIAAIPSDFLSGHFLPSHCLSLAVPPPDIVFFICLVQSYFCYLQPNYLTFHKASLGTDNNQPSFPIISESLTAFEEK